MFPVENVVTGLLIEYTPYSIITESDCSDLFLSKTVQHK